MMPPRPRHTAFTLVELIIVMMVLAVVAAFAAPLLSNSVRARNLSEEAERFVALTEYARNEAVSQGIPMVVWVDPNAQTFGMEPKEGFEGEESRDRDFTLDPDVSFQIDKVLLSGGVAHAVEFAPDGSPSVSSVESLEMRDRFDSALTIVRTDDRWSYEIVREDR